MSQAICLLEKFLFKNSKPIPNLKTIFKQPKPAKISYNGTFEPTKTIPIKVKQNPIKPIKINFDK